MEDKTARIIIGAIFILVISLVLAIVDAQTYETLNFGSEGLTITREGLTITGIVSIVVFSVTLVFLIIYLRKAAKKDAERREYAKQELQEMQQRQAIEQAEHERREREKQEQRIKQAQERHEKAKGLQYKVPYETIENAREILGVLSTAPMTVNEINAALSKEFSRIDVDRAISYIERAAPIVQSWKKENYLSGSGFAHQRNATAYALYENVKGVIFMYINNNAKGSFTIDDIDGMDGAEFEKCIARLFTNMGYKTEITKHSGDQGIDVIARKNGESIGIQAKRYKGKVSNSAVQEVSAGKQFYKVDRVMVITNNEFTPSAKELAEANDVELWDRTILKDKIYQY